AMGVELVRRGEERLAGDDIHLDSRLIIVQKRAGSRALGAAFLGDAVLFRRQRGDRFLGLTVFPHGVALTFWIAKDMARTPRKCKTAMRVPAGRPRSDRHWRRASGHQSAG